MIELLRRVLRPGAFVVGLSQTCDTSGMSFEHLKPLRSIVAAAAAFGALATDADAQPRHTDPETSGVEEVMKKGAKTPPLIKDFRLEVPERVPTEALDALSRPLDLTIPVVPPDLAPPTSDEPLTVPPPRDHRSI